MNKEDVMVAEKLKETAEVFCRSIADLTALENISNKEAYEESILVNMFQKLGMHLFENYKNLPIKFHTDIDKTWYQKRYEISFRIISEKEYKNLKKIEEESKEALKFYRDFFKDIIGPQIRKIINGNAVEEPDGIFTCNDESIKNKIIKESKKDGQRNSNLYGKEDKGL